ncbi:hypothetical protein HYALB_00003916 [Hymenoscyphus albidus]|uniref:Major facilitator superfamily (MFS) profile domain-containing protein n=1 Tax=Hymenoscyphus albidus TaxID=595503 RepID=A0A9N9LQX3_9HELO|nr:hypothetical protein HYALB_00003916 [Hymenoscyphus albidus]
MAKLASEETPLLIASGTGPAIQASQPQGDLLTRKISNNGDTTTSKSTNVEYENVPLPKFQIFVLCVARVIEPMAFFGIFPFVNKMIWETGDIDESDVGFYSGLIACQHLPIYPESMFSFTQMLLMIMWGNLSDRTGRKPVMVFSLTGVAFGTALFGFSKTIWQMILFRCCAGIFAGTVVTIRTMITENSTRETQARAFSFFAFSGNLGILVGPLLGGALSEPAKQYPKVFGHLAIFKQFPYSLPTLVSGLLALLATGTLKRRVADAPAPPPIATMDIIRSPGVPIILFLYGHVMLLGLAYTAVSPVYWFTDISIGGCSFTPMQISYFLAGIGISQATWLLLVFPPLQLKYGTGNVLRLCLYAWPFFFAAAPLCNWFLRKGWTTAFWIVAPTIMIGGSGVAMAFTAVQLALNDISPSQRSLGTLNGVALTLTSGIRTIGPAIFTSLFAVGARTQFLNGYLVWVILILVALLGIVGMRYFPEEAEGRVKKQAVVEE